MKSKTPEKSKRLKLKIGEVRPFSLIGISSHENDYRLVWAINHQLSFQFSRSSDLTYNPSRSGTDLSFSRYSFTDEERYLEYQLVSNRCADGFLFAEIRNLDFVLKINGELSENTLNELVRKLKSIEVVSACFILDSDRLKEIGRVFPE